MDRAEQIRIQQDIVRNAMFNVRNKSAINYTLLKNELKYNIQKGNVIDEEICDIDNFIENNTQVFIVNKYYKIYISNMINLEIIKYAKEDIKI